MTESVVLLISIMLFISSLYFYISTKIDITELKDLKSKISSFKKEFMYDNAISFENMLILYIVHKKQNLKICELTNLDEKNKTELNFSFDKKDLLNLIKSGYLEIDPNSDRIIIKYNAYRILNNFITATPEIEEVLKSI